MHSDWCIHSTCPSHNSFQILMTSFKLLESTQFSHRSLTVLENIQVLVKRVVPPISDLLPTVISLTAALGCTCFRQAVPRSNSALSKRNLTCDLLQELQNILFTKIAGKYISVQWNLLSGMFRKTNKWKHSRGMIWARTPRKNTIQYWEKYYKHISLQMNQIYYYTQEL